MQIQSSSIQLANQSAAQEKTLERERLLFVSSQPSPVDASGSYLLSQRQSYFNYDANQSESAQVYSRVLSGDGQTEVLDRSSTLSQIVQVGLQGEEAVRVIAGGAIGGMSVAGEAIVAFSRYSFTSESQSSTTVSSGVINLQDGTEISFTLYLTRERATVVQSQSSLLISARVMTDPLVLNFGAETATLRNTSFSFDLNGDGLQEDIAELGVGSGYLVLDVNGDGEINNGGEVFGAYSGDGLGDLSRYDADGNRWIDESDPVFSSLRVWAASENGDKQLLSLKEVGVGAIYLGSTPDSFELVGDYGRVLGRTKATGIMLMESGEVRTLQEIDLAHSAPDRMRPSSAEVIEEARAELSLGGAQASSDGAQGSSFLLGMQDVLARLNELRERQKQYLEAMAPATVKFKSPLEQLLTRMEEERRKLQRRLHKD
ncbi:conserved hypothetical protein [Hahella chejuensis KCTC 2396]|uniref:Uncharacterized protein n=1 Tax=Hahella chejuensis (strain KCTC 2396) TaxID=349521 RepID=Q2SK82_HAHCH|nr:hypothetical protein [Hahella chejuensis]ABC28942.1 conserved hypothetical protein [Hahella chejuensis KCTC 2396]